MQGKCEKIILKNKFLLYLVSEFSNTNLDEALTRKGKVNLASFPRSRFFICFKKYFFYFIE